MKGYTGKVLIVDLGRGELTVESIPDSVYEKHLSGIGLAAHLLYSRIPAGAEPLGPDNCLAFVAGLLTGTGALFSGRWMAAALSPLTGTWGEANCGGTLAPAIKACGYDGILFKGIAEQPVYLYVDDGVAELRDASEYWGKDAVTAEELLIDACHSGKRPAVACIGEAGEKLSLISGICNDRGRIAARSGLGAVMGAKRLKALVLAGSQKTVPHDRPKIRDLSRTCNKDYIAKTSLPPIPGATWRILGRVMGQAKTVRRLDGLMSLGVYKRWGTITGNQMAIESGDAPIKNWTGSRLDYKNKLSKHINPDRIIAREKKKYHCAACPLSCGGICEMAGEFKETHKPEYETVIAFSGLLLNADLDSIFYLNELVNRAGMDSISAGATVAFAIDCFENGILTTSETGGLELTWGNTPAIVRLVEMMVAREGIGDLLADGVKVASEKIGRGAAQYAIHAGGQELPMHDPRMDPGYGLHYSVEPMPGRHTAGSQNFYAMNALWEKLDEYPRPPDKFPVEDRFRADIEKAWQARGNSLLKQVLDGAGLCFFCTVMNVTRFPLFEYLNAATGWEKTPREYMQIGQRIQTLKQLFNLRHGVDPWDLKMHPIACGDPPLTDGPNRGRRFDLDQMMRDTWYVLGWDPETGIPTPATLEALGLVRDPESVEGA
jgi:aldehyde:ferredoxin oxidoreductase